jgi:glycerol-3-phosphate dehydrogenase (NAD(P)+)
MFGTMIGKGYSVKYARMEMIQVAEGYFGAKGLAHFMEVLGVDMPIAKTVYQVLYENKSVSKTFKELSEIFK